jgi:hypothetical protein
VVRRQGWFRAVAAALTIAGLAGAACQSDKHTHTPPAATTALHAGAPTAAGTPAAAALVSATQLAGGWSAASSAPADFGAARCDGQPLLQEAGAAAQASFSKGANGPWGIERIGRAAEGGAAAFARINALLRGCRRLSTPAPGGGTIVWTAAPLPFPRLADDSLAQRLTATNAPRPLAADLVLFRHGDTVALVAQIAAPPGPDTATTRTLVQQAEARLLHFLP